MTETYDEPRILDHDRNAELAVLACCLDSRVARDEAKKHLTGGDFHHPVHETIWNAMAGLDRKGEQVDPAKVLSALTGKADAMRLMPTLATYPTSPAAVGEHARAVRAWATKRRLYAESQHVQHVALDPNADADTLAATIVNRFTAVRDAGTTEDAKSITLGELLATEDDEPDWLIPGLLERRDRLILTGEEGLGKSYLLRQLAVMGAAGLDPFSHSQRIRPIKVMILDCENTESQVRRKVRPVVAFAKRYGLDSADQVNLLCSPRIDITRDRDLARIHFELDATQPDLVVVGPLYRLLSRAIQTDDEAVPVLAALDTIRDRDCALLVEAHAGHALGKGGHRDLRPRGSSALLGWPEFGYGMRSVERRVCELVPWRGDRDERAWPERLRVAQDGIRWVPDDAARLERDWA